MKSQKYYKYLIAILLLLSPNFVNAGSAESIMNVSATVAPSCSITASNLNFGPYNFAISNEVAQITILCTNGSKYKLALSPGRGSGATVNNRFMTNNNNLLKYSIYQDSAMSKTWGNDSLTSMAGTGTGIEEYIKVYGRIPGNQKLPPGFYSDEVLISLNIEGFVGISYQLSLSMRVMATIRP